MRKRTTEILYQRLSCLGGEVPPKIDPGSTKAAAVLVPLLVTEPGCPVVFTRRTNQMRRHAGEICLPGGLLELLDEGSVTNAAVREAQEELGLLPTEVQVRMVLPHCLNSRGIIIYPVVGFVMRPLQWQLQVEEVAEVIEVPLSYFLQVEHYRRELRSYDGQKKESLVIDYGSEQIWGLTARIMNSVRLILNGSDWSSCTDPATES